MRITMMVSCVVALGFIMGCGPKKQVEVAPDIEVAPSDVGLSPAVKPIPGGAFYPKPATPATVITPAEPQVRYHTVIKGDTLWALAEQYLGDGHRGDEIAGANPDIANPVKCLPVGKEIIIPAK